MSKITPSNRDEIFNPFDPLDPLGPFDPFDAFDTFMEKSYVRAQTLSNM